MNDDHNPYAPPKAEVSASTGAIEAAVTRPTAVRIATFLIGVQILISVVGVVSRAGGIDDGSQSALGVLLGATNVLLLIVACVFVARGRNWARILFLVMWILSIFSTATWIYMSFFVMPRNYGLDAPWETASWMLVPQLMSLAIVILLFGPGREWFRKRQPSS